MTLTKDAIQIDSPAKTGSPSQSSEANSGQISRSNPVCLEVSVTVRSLPGEKVETSTGQARPTREEARTVIVFDNGAVLRLAGNFPLGQSVILSNAQGRDVVCRVVKARNLPTVKGYIEIEFVETVNDFWGIHQVTGQSNAPNPPVVPVMAPPQLVPSNPAAAPPTSSSAAPKEAETESVESLGNGPSFDDIAGLVRMAPAAAQSKVPQASPRTEVLKPALQKPLTTKPSVPVSDAQTQGQAKESKIAQIALADSIESVLSWENPATPVRKPSPPAEFLGGGIASPSQTFSGSLSSEPRGKSPLVIIGAAVILVGLGAGYFFMNRGSDSSSKAPVSATAQASPSVIPAAAEVPESNQRPQTIVGQAPSSTPDISTVSSVSNESVVTPAISTSQANRRPTSNVEAKQSSPSDNRRPAIPNLKMSAPTAANRTGRLVDGSVPNIASLSPTEPVGGGAALSTMVRTEAQPAPPPIAVGSSGVPSKAAVREPKLITSTHPVYPTLARQSNVQGSVVVVAQVDASGKVFGAQAISGPILLRQAAIDAVRQWKYEPALINGKPGAAEITIKLDFRMNQ